MATKTISLELDAYEKLRSAKKSERESFSSVVRRANWDQSLTARDLLNIIQNRKQNSDVLSKIALKMLDKAQSVPRRTNSKW